MHHFHRLTAGVAAVLLCGLTACSKESPAPQPEPTEPVIADRTPLEADTEAPPTEAEAETEAEVDAAAEQLARSVLESFDPHTYLFLGGEVYNAHAKELWFQDIDLDGTPEFLARADSPGEELAIYRITDGQGEQLFFPFDSMTNGSAAYLIGGDLTLIQQNGELYYVACNEADENYHNIFRLEPPSGTQIYEKLLFTTDTWTDEPGYYVGFDEDTYESEAVTAADFKKRYQDYFQDAVVCRQNIRKIPAASYNDMDPEKRLAALIESCTAWSYTPDSSAKLPLQSIVEAISDKAAPPQNEASGTDSLFAVIPKEYLFASGAGGWGTSLTIEQDGSFTGCYSDSNMGETGDGYPNGTVYICDFRGRFTDVKQISDTIYSMRLDYISWDGEPGDEYIEDGVRYIYSTPYGFDDADDFMVYLPGCKVSSMPESFIGWAHLLYDLESETYMPAGAYGIYNVQGEEGFVNTSAAP